MPEAGPLFGQLVDRRAMYLHHEEVFAPTISVFRINLMHESFVNHAVKSAAHEQPHHSLGGRSCRIKFRLVVPKAFSALKTHLHTHGVASPGVQDRMSEAERPAARTTQEPALHIRFNLRHVVTPWLTANAPPATLCIDQ